MKYYSLIDKVYNLENLRRAYKSVKASNGAPGVDGQTVRAFGERFKPLILDIMQQQLQVSKTCL